MASIRYRDNKWQARVVRKGQKPIARSFLTKLDAERWSRSVETDMDRGLYINTSEAENTTLGDLINRYIAEVTPTMRGAKADSIRLKAITRMPIARINLSDLTPTKIANYRDERLTQIKAGALIRELSYLSSIINHARREWSINITNPVSLVRKPPSPQGRSRILSDDERVRLINESKQKDNRVAWLEPLILLALETGMRRGELLGLNINDINLDTQVALLKLTKNGDSRYVPLSLAAVKIIKNLPLAPDGRLFPINPHCVSPVFNRARDRAELKDFHFHDLRHTAITIMAEKLTNLIELASVTGHRSLKMLNRYYHPDPQILAKKLG